MDRWWPPPVTRYAAVLGDIIGEATSVSSILNESLSKLGGSINPSTETSSVEGTVDTVEGVPNAESGRPLLVVVRGSGYRVVSMAV